jgi:uncharacterized membrane protein (UPF0127 family)
MQVRRIEDDAIVCPNLVMGESFGQRFMGLMGRAEIDSDEGLYLPSSSIHMMFMRFPIDALFVSKADSTGQRRVVGIRESLPPWRGIVMPVRGAEGVVELKAGALAQRGVGVGDTVMFESTDAASADETAVSEV